MSQNQQDTDEVKKESEEDYTDYRRSKWQAIEYYRLYWPATIKRLPTLLFLSAVGVVVALKLDALQTQVYKGELFLLMMFYWLIALLSINTIWHWIKMAQGNRLINYEINKKGVVIDDKKYSWEDVDQTELNQSLKKLKQSKNYKNKFAKPRFHFVFPITVKKKKKMLVFENEENRQKMIRAAEYYLNLKQ